MKALALARAGREVDLDSPESIQLSFFFGSVLAGVEEAFLQ
jgi:hypothetical protein